jgi:hypothetical protein
MAKTCLKVFKVNRCRLMNHLLLEALASLEVDRYVMSGHESAGPPRACLIRFLQVH